MAIDYIPTQKEYDVDSLSEYEYAIICLCRSKGWCAELEKLVTEYNETYNEFKVKHNADY